MARLAPKPSTISKLLALSGGVCAFNGCQTSLVQEGVFCAALAHICAASTNGPRFDTGMTDEERRAFENLMYMCPNHGAIIDKNKLHEKYTVEVLRKMKANHEARHVGKPYIPADDVFDDAFEEAQITAIQTNTINGDRNTQINNQVVFAAGEQVSESANALLKQLGKPAPTPTAKTDTADDDDPETPEDPGTPTKPSNPPTNPGKSAQTLSNTEDGTPGTVDSIAAAEELTPQWAQTISEINEEIVRIGEYTNESALILTAQNKRNASMSARIPVFRQLAKRLSDPANRIEDLSAQFTIQLKEIDPGIRAMIELATNTAADDPDRRAKAYTLYASIEEIASSSNVGFSSLEKMLSSTEPIEKMSVDLRKPLLKIRRSLQSMLKTKGTIDGWLALVAGSKAKFQ